MNTKETLQSLRMARRAKSQEEQEGSTRSERMQRAQNEEIRARLMILYQAMRRAGMLPKENDQSA